jgi:hypothetical protein
MRPVETGNRNMGVFHGRRIVVTGGAGFLAVSSSASCANAAAAISSYPATPPATSAVSTISKNYSTKPVPSC